MNHRPIIALAVLLAATLSVVPAQAAATEVAVVAVHFADGSPISAPIEIVGSTEQLRFSANTTENATGAQLILRLNCGGSSCVEIRRTMTDLDGSDVNAGDEWAVLLGVSEPEIVEGSWTVTVHAFDAQGLVASKTAAGTLDFKADDDDAPVLELVGGGTSARLGVSDNLRINVSDASLQKVTYRISGMAAPAPLPAPYVIDGAGFGQGTSSVVVAAHDRAGHATSLTVTVQRDTIAPATALVLPEAIFAHIPFEVSLAVSDASAYDVQVRFAGETHRLAGVAGATVHKLDLATNKTGNVSLAIFVVDGFDNVFSSTRSFSVESASTNASLESIAIAAPELPPLSGQEVTFKIAVAQASGDVRIPLRLDWALDGAVTNRTLSVGLNESVNHTFVQGFAAGYHSLFAAVTAPAYVNETDVSNQNQTLDFEVFMGRVLHGNDIYNVRVGTNGLPLEAVRGNQTYSMAFDENSATTRYVFTVDGRELSWDPVTQVTTIVDPEATPGKKSPGMGLLSILAILGLAAVSLRRR